MNHSYTFTVNGQPFRTATKALANVNKLRKAGTKIETLRVNNEPLMLSELEATATLEAQEKAHNKRQGL